MLAYFFLFSYPRIIPLSVLRFRVKVGNRGQTNKQTNTHVCMYVITPLLDHLSFRTVLLFPPYQSTTIRSTSNSCKCSTMSILSSSVTSIPCPRHKFVYTIVSSSLSFDSFVLLLPFFLLLLLLFPLLLFITRTTNWSVRFSSFKPIILRRTPTSGCARR